MNIKQISVFISLGCSGIAFAHTGSYSVTCQGVGNADVQFSVNRMNATGFRAPQFSLTMNKQVIELSAPSESKSYGKAVKDIPIGFIYLTVKDKKAYNLSLKAIPSTVQIESGQGKDQQWNIQQEQNACYDSKGKANFQGILSGKVMVNGQPMSIQPTQLQCTIEYDSGMAC